MAGIVLTAVGFESNVAPSEEAKLAMRVLFGLVPAGSLLIGTLLFLRFSFNQKQHSDVLGELRTRAAARGS